MPRVTSEFAQKHSFVSGSILVAIGVAGIIGSVSGNLAGMLAALFDPLDLDTASAAAIGNAPPAVGPGNPPGTPGEPSTPSNPSLPAPSNPTAPSLPGPPEIGGIPLPEIAV